MDYKKILNKYNTKWDIPYVKYALFKEDISKLNEIDENNDELLIYALAELYDIEPQHLKQCTIIEIDELLKKVLSIAQTPSKLQNRIKINNIEYGLIPDFSKITTAELIDLDTNLKNNHITKIISILYRPITKKQFNPFGILGQTRYTIEPHNKDNSKIFENVNLEIVDGVLDFFLFGYQKSNNNL